MFENNLTALQVLKGIKWESVVSRRKRKKYSEHESNKSFLHPDISTLKISALFS